jgi:hypothetical protein
VYNGLLGISLNTHLLKARRILRDGTPLVLPLLLPETLSGILVPALALSFLKTRTLFRVSVA